jgi:hypothetical protein
MTRVYGKRHAVALVALSAVWLSGCASYRVPGGPADLRALGVSEDFVEQNTDAAIAGRLALKPLAGFPTAIAVVRVQDRGYVSYTARGYGEGRYTVVTVRDVETDEDFDRLHQLPMVRGIAPLNRLVLPTRLRDDSDLRQGAATVRADMLLIYTFDTTFEVKDKVPPLGILTLGLFPDDHARIASTVSAVLMDTRNGYVYALLEATVRKEKTTSGWTRDAVVDEVRREAETEAFQKLVGEFETTWQRVVDEYAPTRRAG